MALFSSAVLPYSMTLLENKVIYIIFFTIRIAFFYDFFYEYFTHWLHHLMNIRVFLKKLQQILPFKYLIG